MNQTQLPPLDSDLHMRIPSHFAQSLNETATKYNLKTSTFSRYVLMRHLPEYVSRCKTSSDAR